MTDDRVAMKSGPEYCECPNKIPRQCACCGMCWWCGLEVDSNEKPKNPAVNYQGSVSYGR